VKSTLDDMKRAIIFLSVVMIALAACSQDIPASKVPSVVQNTVTGKFTHANTIEWEKKKNVYEAEFDIDKVEHTVYVETDGKLLLVKKDIPVTSLPQHIIAAINRDHAGYTIDDADQIDKDGIIYYEVELEKKKAKDIRLVYSAGGIVTTNISYIH
jgi:hypothetical protein